MNRHIISDRISNIPKTEVSLLEIDLVAENIKSIRKIISNPRHSCCSQISQVDTSDLNTSSIRQWLAELELGEFSCYVYWVALNQGAKISINAFINYYDDLWFPAMDDIWITGLDIPIKWILEMNHEEIFTFYNI